MTSRKRKPFALTSEQTLALLHAEAGVESSIETSLARLSEISGRVQSTVSGWVRKWVAEGFVKVQRLGNKGSRLTFLKAPPEPLPESAGRGSKRVRLRAGEPGSSSLNPPVMVSGATPDQGVQPNGMVEIYALRVRTCNGLSAEQVIDLLAGHLSPVVLTGNWNVTAEGKPDPRTNTQLWALRFLEPFKAGGVR